MPPLLYNFTTLDKHTTPSFSQKPPSITNKTTSTSIEKKEISHVSTHQNLTNLKKRKASAFRGNIEEKICNTRYSAEDLHALIVLHERFSTENIDLIPLGTLTKTCNDIRITLHNINFLHFPRISLHNNTYTSITFKKCIFNRKMLQHARFVRCTFAQCSFESTILTLSQLQDCHFSCSKFNATLFPAADLEKVIFHQCKFHSVSFEDALLKKVYFQKCTLTASHFLDAHVVDSAIVDSTIYNTQFFCTQKEFQFDENTKKTCSDYMPYLGMLVFTDTFGLSTPLLANKLQRHTNSALLRIAMDSLRVTSDDVKNELQCILTHISPNKHAHHSIPKQILLHMAENSQQFPAISKIISKAKSLSTVLNGIALPGGKDIHPLFYGQSIIAPHTNCNEDFRRSLLEIALISEAYKKGIPLIAICRGFQMLTIYHGKTLLQHIGDNQHGSFELAPNDRKNQTQGIYASLLHQLKTFFYHHQAVPTHLPDNSELYPSSIYRDWIIAVEPKKSGAAPIIGLQFHPEFYPHKKNMLQYMPAAKESDNKTIDLSPSNDMFWSIFSTTAHTHYIKKKALSLLANTVHHLRVTLEQEP